MKFDSMTGEIVRVLKSEWLPGIPPDAYAGKLALVLYSGNGSLSVLPEGTFGCPVTVTEWERVAVPEYHTPLHEMKFIYGAASVSRVENEKPVQ